MGCGCGTILAIITLISFVGWALSMMDGSPPMRQYQAVPDHVPPDPGAAVPQVEIHQGGRPANALAWWADPIAERTNIPPQALRAYAYAELYAAEAWPNCHLKWNTLAGIGQVETRHGTYSGRMFGTASLDENGVVHPPIIGVPLDGSPGFAHIPDTDGGQLDGDPVYDRAVGPMQFIPSSWRQYGMDGNGDGVADPNQIDDAALTAAHLLCTESDLATADGWTSAISSYNQSTKYTRDVRDAANSYALEQPAV
ncbi:hypothetical protein GP475_04170 [Corynebacterium poyangense]|uniref:Transglycosylase SLT domain-containing protein n=1 Tax=Corynebacterium poyangense TaxID=2684405 RepID=A0A7H0SS70_9CORY|nr:lytic murein transglycosylase [Corynebacterium poyangense]MBZ8176231.1 hypothetical protein [Corynebacterium poyangense]QNQ91395.1 hypothetical protein GP475_04170 [Corynebacterium poyangense]